MLPSFPNTSVQDVYKRQVLDGSSVFFANGLLVGDDNEQGRLMRSSDEIRSSASVPAELLAEAERLRRDSM